MQTLSWTTGSVTAGGSLEINQTIPDNLSIVVLEKIKIEQNSPVGGNHQAAIYSKDAFAAGDKLWDSGVFTGTLVDPVENDSNVLTERGWGVIVIYEDEDASAELHLKIWNNDSSAKTYDVTVTYREYPLVSSGNLSVGDLTASGTITIQNLTVNSAGSFGDLTSSGNLSIGTLTASGNIVGSAAATIASGLTVTSGTLSCKVLSVGSGATVTGDLTTNGDLSIGTLTASGNITSSAATTIASGLTVTSGTLSCKVLAVGSGATVDGGLIVDSGNLRVDGSGPHAYGAILGQAFQRFQVNTGFAPADSGSVYGVLVDGELNANADGGTTYIYKQLCGGTIVTAASADTHARIATLAVLEPAIENTASATITVAATLYINGAPTEGGSNYAVHSDAGLNRFDGDGTHVFELPADGTDPTSALTDAPSGRIPIKVGGATRYIPYWT